MIQFKDKHYAYFHNIMLSSITYDVQVIAHTDGGSTVSTVQQSFRDIYKSYLGKLQ